MSFLENVLEQPRYGYRRNGELYKPSPGEILREFVHRYNPFITRKNWLTFVSWSAAFLLVVPFLVFMFGYFSWKLLAIGLAYSMIWMGTHGTIYLHRYGTHRAFVVRNGFWKFVIRNLSIKVIPEEIYVVSHHVHHSLSEKPGDPYNVHAGWLYCFLSDANHHPIAQNLSQPDYERVARMVSHMGMKTNSYEQYRKWGSLAHPLRTVAHYALNWAFWYGVFYLMGGHALSTAVLGIAAIWAFGVRTFNYEGHGQGKDKRREGSDFNRADLSVNQIWPGYVSGEWHNNHHLYPNGARAGFLSYQLDLAWIFIWTCHALGIVTSYRDYKGDFMRDHWIPYLRSKRSLDETPAHAASRQ